MSLWSPILKSTQFLYFVKSNNRTKKGLDSYMCLQSGSPSAVHRAWPLQVLELLHGTGYHDSLHHLTNQVLQNPLLIIPYLPIIGELHLPSLLMGSPVCSCSTVWCQLSPAWVGTLWLHPTSTHQLTYSTYNNSVLRHKGTPSIENC